jgi:hypothetical protein
VMTTTLFDDDGSPVYPIRYDASITLDAMDCLRLWDYLQAPSSDAYSDTYDWVLDMLDKLAKLPTAGKAVGR